MNAANDMQVFACMSSALLMPVGGVAKRRGGEWYNLRSSNQPEVAMSADKDRAIRRQKQKRAKDLKKQARPQPAVAAPKKAAAQKAA